MDRPYFPPLFLLPLLVGACTYSPQEPGAALSYRPPSEAEAWDATQREGQPVQEYAVRYATGRQGDPGGAADAAQVREGGLRASDYGVIISYFGFLLLIGTHFARHERTTDDFFLAGRRIPWWAAGLSIFGTQLSAITFLAVPAKAFETDWLYFLVNMTIILVAPVVVYCYLPVFRRLNVTSAYEYLEQRFNLAVRFFGSLAFVLFQVGRIGIVLYLPALALAAITGLDVYLCIVLMGVLATLYTALGGIEAVVWTDVAQVVVLLGGALLALALLIVHTEGGLVGLIHTGAAAGKFHMFNWTWDYTAEAVWLVVVGNVFANLIPYTTDQAVIQRYLTTPTQAQAARAIWTNAALTLPASLLFFGLGTALFVFYQARPGLLDPALPNDAVFPLFIAQQMPPGALGLIVAAIFAAAMSSLDSSLNSVAAAIVTDGYRRFFPAAPDGAALSLARRVTVAFGAIGTGTAVLLAASDVGSLLDLFREILGLFGGSLSGLFMLGIFTRRANGAGALMGAVCSAAILFLVQHATPMHFFLYAAVGTLSCFGIGYGASLAFHLIGSRVQVR